MAIDKEKESYINDFISQYAACFNSITGFSPEISAADYILLRKQALAEYIAQPGSAQKPPDHGGNHNRNPDPSPPVQLQSKQEAIPTQLEDHEREQANNPPSTATKEEDELAILQSLRDD